VTQAMGRGSTKAVRILYRSWWLTSETAYCIIRPLCRRRAIPVAIVVPIDKRHVAGVTPPALVGWFHLHTGAFGNELVMLRPPVLGEVEGCVADIFAQRHVA